MSRRSAPPDTSVRVAAMRESNRSMGAMIFEKQGIIVTAGATLLMTLQFQTTPLPIQAQVTPLTAVLCLFLLPLVWHSIRTSPLLKSFSLFFGFLFLHSMVLLGIEMLTGQPQVRFMAWFRQVIALIAGMSTFLVLRHVLLSMPIARVIRYVIIGAIPSLALGILNVVWGMFKIGWLGSFILAVRSAVAPFGWTSEHRATGFAMEPATFAAALAITVMPFLFYLLLDRNRKPSTWVLAGVTLACFAWTFSLTGILIFLGLVFAGMMLGPSKKFMLAAVACTLVAVGAVLVILPNNQILAHVFTLSEGTDTVSFTDRFFSTVGPFQYMFASRTLIGYGLGGTATHFAEFMPPAFIADILAVKWQEYPNLNSLPGRVMAEAGIIGVLLLVQFGYVMLKQLRLLIARAENHRQETFFRCARLGTIAVLLSLVIGFGSFHNPYLWFWAALIDAQYILSRDAQSAGNVSAAIPDSA